MNAATVARALRTGHATGRAPRQTLRYQRPPMYAKQVAAFFGPERWVAIEASTKAGKTTGALFWLTERAVLDPVPGGVRWWIAPVYPQAEIAYRRFKIYNAATRGTLWTCRDVDREIELVNGQRIAFKSGEKPDNLFGEDVRDAIADEASRIRNESWHAIRSTLTATRGALRAIGNVRGRANWHYELARRAEGGAPNHAYHKITADDAIAAGVLAAEEVEDARRSLPRRVFEELYYCVPSDDGGNPFGLEAIRAASAPLTRRPVVAWGWDLAKSLNYTVGVGLDEHGHVAALERFQLPWPETMGRIRRATGGTRALIDETGVGDPIVEMFRRPRSFGIAGAPVPNLEGLKLNATNKQQLLEALAVAIQERRTTVPYEAGELEYPRTEYESFEFRLTRTHTLYAAPDGLDDDIVIAHALALAAWASARRGASHGGALVAF